MMRAGLGRLAFAAGVAAVLAGCGPSAGAPAEVSFADYRMRLVAAYCKLAVACEEMPDEATCLATIQLQPGYVATLQQDIDGAKTKFDGNAAARCLAAIEGLPSCKKSGLGATAAVLDEGCAGLFTGTVAVGGACFFGEECASGLCQPTDVACSPRKQCCAGTCANVPPPIPAGGDCSMPMANQSCATGSTCRGGLNGQTNTCMSPVATEGAACTNVGGCRYPLFCDVASVPGATGTCKRPAATGETCNPQASQSCDDGRDVCLAETMKCTPKVAVGTACTPNNCVGWAVCLNATCVARPKVGEGCDPTFGAQCLGGSVCTVLSCTITPAGDACL
jgi:hypothetical protein